MNFLVQKIKKQLIEHLFFNKLMKKKFFLPCLYLTLKKKQLKNH